MISFKNFIVTVKENFRNAKYGIDLKTKIKLLFLLSLLQFISSKPSKLICNLSKKLEILINYSFRDLTIRINNVKYVVNNLGSFNIILPKFEKEVLYYLYFRLNKSQQECIFIDVGAHIGKYTIHVAKMIGNAGKVIAIEAHPENYKYLLKNIKINNLNNVIAYNIAACDSIREVRLYIGDAEGHHSIVKNFGKDYIKIQGFPIDYIIDKLNLNKVSYIKIDVEGAEYLVLCGLKNTLKKYSPEIIIEVLNKNYSKVLNFLRNLNYNSNVIFEEPKEECKYLICYKNV